MVAVADPDRVTRVLALLSVVVVGTALVSSVASWPDDLVLLDPDVVALDGWGTGVIGLVVVLLGGLHFCAAHVGYRMHGGVAQIHPDDVGSWNTVTVAAYRHAQGVAVRAAASFGIVPATAALLSCIGRLRWRPTRSAAPAVPSSRRG